MSTTDKRQDTNMINRMDYYMKQISQKVIINYSDSRDSICMRNIWLSRGILSMVQNKWESYVKNHCQNND